VPVAAVSAIVAAGCMGGPCARAGCSKPGSVDVPSELLTATSSFPPRRTRLPVATPLAPLLAAEQPDQLAVLEPADTALNLQTGEPLLLRFNRPMVDITKVGKPAGEPPVRWRPAVASTQTWTGRSVLRIEPSLAAWDHSHVASMTLSPELRSLADESVAGFETRTVVFDASPRYQGRRSARIVGEDPAVMLFDGKVSTAELSSRMLVYEVDGGRRMLPFALTAKARDDKGRIPVELKPEKLLDPGGKFAVALAPMLSHGGSHPRVVEFELAPRPRIEGIACPIDAKEASECEHTDAPGAIVDIGEQLVLLASTALGSVAPASIEVTPTLPALRVTLEDSKRVLVRGDWSPGQVYQVRLRDLRDKEGHALMRLPPLAVRSKGRTPEVRVATGRITFERDARASLPFTAIHVQEGTLRWSPVPAGQELIAAVDGKSFVVGPTSQARTVGLGQLAPDARPNRWGSGTFSWIDNDPSRALIALFAFLPDASEREPESIPITHAQWTDLGIDARVLSEGVSVWVTSIASAAPVAGAAVTVADAKGTALAEARTDEHGLAFIGVKAGSMDPGAVVRAVLGDDRAVLVVDPRSSMGPRHLGITPGEAPGPTDAPVAVVFTDRGLCRPGETIHAKAVLRSPGAEPHAIAGGMLRMRLFGPTGAAPLESKDLPLTSFGTASADFVIDPAREAGGYKIEAWREPFAQPVGTASFTVGEYRPPVFRVDLASDSEALVEGETLHAVLSAAWPFGTPASGARAHWSLTKSSSGQDFPERWAEYTFQPADVSARSGIANSAEVVLGQDGRFAIESRVTIGVPVRQSVVLEATVRDASGQTTSARRQFDTFPAAYEVGVHDAPDWLEAGSTLDAEAVVLSHAGEPQPGRSVEARIVREGWHTWWQWSQHAHRDDGDEGAGAYNVRKSKETKVVHSCRLSSTTEPVHCPWKADKPGTYLLEASSRDDQGRVSIASVRVYVAGPDEHPDRDAPGTTIALTPSKAAYEVGETAEVAFESPFPDAGALLRIERQKSLGTQHLRAVSGGNVLRFQVTPDMVPNAFVSVSLVRPRTGPPGKDIDLNAPDLRVGVAEISVRPKASPLTVKIGAPEGTQRAGADLPIEVSVSEADGKPGRAELALYVVDEGTLRLTGYRTPDPGPDLFPRTAAWFAWDDVRRSLVSRAEKNIFPAAGGDGGSSQDPARNELRERFEPTPLWIASARTDDAGKVKATVHLPSRPAEYRIMAVAIDEGARSGRAEHQVHATRNIVARTVLPRFVTEGDSFEAVLMLNNTTDRAMDVSVTATVDRDARKPRVFHVEAGREQRVAEPVSAAARAPVSLTFAIDAEGDHEQVKREVPVDARGRTVKAEVVGKAGTELTIELPASSTGAELSLAVASHPFVGFDMAVQALEGCTWGGVEPAASSLIGLASLARLDAAKRPAAAELAARADMIVGKLRALQTPSGGFGKYAALDAPEPYLSMYALHALLQAKRAGWQVPEEVTDKAVKWGVELAKGSAFLDRNEDSGRNDLAFALRVLAQASAADGMRIQALYDQRQALSPIGLSNLALAMDVHERRRDTLIFDAVRKVLATREDERRDPSLLRWYDSSSRTLATVLEAASSSDPVHPDARKLASLLLQRRTADGQGSWWSTHETSYALAGLAAYGARMRSAEPLKVRARLDGAALDARQQGRDQTLFSLAGANVQGGAHTLRLETDAPAFFFLSGHWVEPLGEEDSVARGNEVALHRVLENEAGAVIAPGGHVKLGDLVRVRLFVFSEHDAPPFVAIRDRFGGGLEPVDAALETSPREALSALLGMEDGEDGIDPRGQQALRSLDALEYRSFGERDAVFYLSGGTGLREFTYGARAATPGTFVLPPAQLEALYVPGFVAMSAASSLVVDP
jgi:alpha-2-macroglobulin